MDSLVRYAFRELVSRFDQLTIIEPQSFTALLNIYSELQIISGDFEELLRFIARVESLNEE